MMNFNFTHYFWIIVFLSISTTANLRGEKYKTLYTDTNDTIYSSSEGRSIIENYGIKSTNSLRIEAGEVAHIHYFQAETKPESILPSGFNSKNVDPGIGKFLINYHYPDGLEVNRTINNYVNFWDVDTNGAEYFQNRNPIFGPCTISIVMRPKVARPSGINSWYDNTDTFSYKNDGPFFFHASIGAVVFRITGSPESESVNTKKFATVIPENSSGNVNIILEQSTDLINWTAANPGSYPPSTSKRFFRVRAE
jgi:hypothetical protein